MAEKLKMALWLVWERREGEERERGRERRRERERERRERGREGGSVGPLLLIISHQIGGNLGNL